MKELLNRKAKMLELMLEYIEKDNPLYHNTMIRIDEINRILKEIENNEKEDVETSRNKRSDYWNDWASLLHRLVYYRYLSNCYDYVN